MADNNNKSRFYLVYLIGFFTILALPLLSLPPWFSPSDWGKTVIFRIVMSILLFLFILDNTQKKTEQYAEQRGNIERRGIFSVVQRSIQRSSASLPFWLLVALGGIYFLATVFSVDPLFSLWGSPWRSGGFVNFVFYIVLTLLAFFIIKQKDWQKLWDWTIVVGILVSLIAIFQQFGYFKEIFITFETRAPSTIGGPIFLAIYLLLLSFLCLSFLIKEKKLAKKLFYLISLLLFIFVAVFITQTRAVMIGYFFGFFFFILFYPVKQKSISIFLKLTALIIAIISIAGFIYINTAKQLPDFISNNNIISDVVSRLSIKTGIEDVRILGWQVAFSTVKDRPIFGWGPENFGVGFEKFYNPIVSDLSGDESTLGGWWDRAHNFLLDIATTAGIPALLVYLALFGVLFWQLQRIKSAEKYADRDADKMLIAHGIQATFIGYLVANLFSFDTFSTYLISFLLIGYSLHLISTNNLGKENAEKISANQRRNQRKFSGSERNFSTKNIATIIILLLILVWLNWQYNIKPFNINTQINIAKFLAGKNMCEQAFERIDNVLPQKSFLDAYLRLKYVDYIKTCPYVATPEKKLEYTIKGTELLKENINTQPKYVRNWILLEGFQNVLIDREQNPEARQKLIQEAIPYFKEAEKLSPKRQEIYLQWSIYAMLSSDYKLMQEKSQKCVDINPRPGDCFFYLGISQIYLEDFENAKNNINVAFGKGQPISIQSFSLLAKAWAEIKNYQELVPVYSSLIQLNPNNAQYHASLAFVYRELKEYDKARKEALKFLEMSPGDKAEVDAFIETLR